MPIQYKIIQSIDLSWFRWSGFVTSEEYLDALGNYVNDSAFRPGRREFVDISELVDFKADFTRMVSLNTIIQSCYGTGERTTMVVVYAPNDTIFGVARMMEQLVTNNTTIMVEVHADLDEAYSALGLDASAFEGALTANVLSSAAAEDERI